MKVEPEIVILGIVKNINKKGKIKNILGENTFIAHKLIAQKWILN